MYNNMYNINMQYVKVKICDISMTSHQYFFIFGFVSILYILLYLLYYSILYGIDLLL